MVTLPPQPKPQDYPVASQFVTATTAWQKVCESIVAADREKANTRAFWGGR